MLFRSVAKYPCGGAAGVPFALKLPIKWENLPGKTAFPGLKWRIEVNWQIPRLILSGFWAVCAATGPDRNKLRSHSISWMFIQCRRP